MSKTMEQETTGSMHVVTYHHFCHIVLVTQTGPDTVCEGGCYSEPRIAGGGDYWGHLEGRKLGGL